MNMSDSLSSPFRPGGDVMIFISSTRDLFSRTCFVLIIYNHCYILIVENIY